MRIKGFPLDVKKKILKNIFCLLLISKWAPTPVTSLFVCSYSLSINKEPQLFPMVFPILEINFAVFLRPIRAIFPINPIVPSPTKPTIRFYAYCFRFFIRFAQARVADLVCALARPCCSSGSGMVSLTISHSSPNISKTAAGIMTKPAKS